MRLLSSRTNPVGLSLILPALLSIMLLGTGCSLAQLTPRPTVDNGGSASSDPNPDDSDVSGDPSATMPRADLPDLPARKLDPTPVLDQSAELAELKQYMLDLINRDRADQGLPPVRLGTNTASQRHAEDMLANSYLAHWGRDGLKPYMRYTLAGGVDYEAENVSGPVFREEGVRYVVTPPKESLAEAQVGLMNSPGHRRNILNPWHKIVNLGIACNESACAVSQQFQGDYIEFDRGPVISDGYLGFSGTMTDGFALSGVQVWYDPPPHPLTLGQLDATHSYGLGRPVVFLRRPLDKNSYYTENSSEFEWESGVDPYEVDPNTPRAKPICDGDVCSYPPTPPSKVYTTDVPWVTAEVWDVAEGDFTVVADISEVLNAYGPGVYTVSVWADRDNDSVPLTRYSIFVK